jgi:HSP20 family molecular chaperone IbpA
MLAVRDIMTSNMFTVEADATVNAAIAMKQVHSGYQVKMDAPGVSVDDLDVSGLGHRLFIEGWRRPFQPSPKGADLLREAGYSFFRRTVFIPDPSWDGVAQATLDGGVLTLPIPSALWASTRINPLPR